MGGDSAADGGSNVVEVNLPTNHIKNELERNKKGMGTKKRGSDKSFFVSL